MYFYGEKRAAYSHSNYTAEIVLGFLMLSTSKILYFVVNFLYIKNL